MVTWLSQEQVSHVFSPKVRCIDFTHVMTDVHEDEFRPTFCVRKRYTQVGECIWTVDGLEQQLTRSSSQRSCMVAPAHLCLISIGWLCFSGMISVVRVSLKDSFSATTIPLRLAMFLSPFLVLCVPLSAALQITDIQGPAFRSPFEGVTVDNVTGIVTAKVRYHFHIL